MLNILGFCEINCRNTQIQKKYQKNPQKNFLKTAQISPTPGAPIHFFQNQRKENILCPSHCTHLCDVSPLKRKLTTKKQLSNTLTDHFAHNFPKINRNTHIKKNQYCN